MRNYLFSKTLIMLSTFYNHLPFGICFPIFTMVHRVILQLSESITLILSMFQLNMEQNSITHPEGVNKIAPEFWQARHRVYMELIGQPQVDRIQEM
jgi:hypothetical protein